MIIYRPHRELLEDAMREAKEFETIEDMKEYIAKKYSEVFCIGRVSSEDISIDDSPPVNDDRIGWKDTRYVLLKHGKSKMSHCIGMCATDYGED